MSNKVNKKWEINVVDNNSNAVYKHFSEWCNLVKIHKNAIHGDLWTEIGDKRFLNLKFVPTPEEEQNSFSVNFTCDTWEYLK